MLWKCKGTKAKEVKPPRPMGIHELAGRYMAVEEKNAPDWILKFGIHAGLLR